MSNSSKISSEDVVEYLKENPDFFNLNPESLSQINLKHESGDAISLIEKQIIELRKSSDQANKHLIQILENAKRNEKLFLLSREIILSLLASSTIDDTVNELESYFINSFNTDACKVIFFSEDKKRFGKERVTSPDLATDLFRDQFKDKDIIQGGISFEISNFVFGAKAQIQEAAICKLECSTVTGIFAIGSKSLGRYSSEKDNLFLLFIVSALSKFIDRIILSKSYAKGNK